MSDASAQQRYEMAQQLQRQGKFAEAERYYRGVLASYGDYIGLLLRLAEVCFLQRHFEDAVKFYERALVVAPGSAAAPNGLGSTLNELGRHQEALVAFAKVADSDALSVDAHCNAGNVLVKLAQHQEAIAQYEVALAGNPDHVPSLNNLGATLLLIQEWERAAACFQRALHINSDLITAHFGLGRALQNMEDHEAAVEAFRTVVALDPSHVLALNLLGRSLSALGQGDLASEAFGKSLACDPANADTHFDHGIGLKYLGRFAEARHAFEQAIAIDPDAPTYWQSIVTGQRIREGDPAITTLEAMLQRAASYSEADQVILYFALAKVYDDLARHHEAFECLAKGNSLERRLTAYDESEEVGQLRWIASLFSAEFIAARAGCGDRSEVPVFVVGMPRSGTTLVEQILASHPKVFGGGEFGDLGRIFDAHQGTPEGLSSGTFRKVGSRYVEKLRRRAPEALRIVNKMPGNFASVGLIALALPKARIIHVRRDPLDTCFSCYFNLFTYGHLYTYDLAELGRYYRAYETLMEHWRKVLPANAMLDVRYEDLVNDLDAGARRIISYCGLDWDARCLEFHKTERPVITTSATQVRQPLFKTSIGRWRPYAAWLGPLREALGEGETA